MSRILGTDQSHWQVPAQINWANAKAGGVFFTTSKSSQGDYLTDECFQDHTKRARDAGFIAGAFHWVDPMQSPAANGGRFLTSAENSGVTYLCPDLEQWWADWAKYRAWRDGVASASRPPRFDPGRLANHTVQLIEWLEARWSGPVITYTRMEYLTSYCPAVLPFFKGRKMWLAQYPWYPPAPEVMTWDQVRESIPDDDWHPMQPDGVDARMVQWIGDRVITPAFAHVWDMDYFDGNEQEMRVWLGAEAPAPPSEFTDAEKLARLWADHPHLHGA